MFNFGTDTNDIFFPVINNWKNTELAKLLPANISVNGSNLIPGYIVMFRNSRFFHFTLKLLNDYHQPDNILDNSGTTLSLLTSLIDKHKEHGIKTRYFESDDPYIAFAANTEEKLNYAKKILPKPYPRKFSRVKVILNPVSGKNPKIPKFLGTILGVKQNSAHRLESSDNYAKHILHTLEQMGIMAEIAFSNSSEDATNIARSCADNQYDLVIAAGGDGTINSVANGLAGTQTVLGVIPLGTINLFALELDIPIDIESACQIIGRGNIRSYDLGKVNNRYFTCLCGIGFDAYVITRTETELKKKIGAVAYILNGIKNMIRYPFHSIQISIDHQPEQSGYIVIIGNGKHYSASVLIAADASPDDGILDIVIFKKRDAISLLRYVWELQHGDLTALPDIKYVRGKTISVRKHGHHRLHLDGEYFGRTPVEITIVPSALRVVG